MKIQEAIGNKILVLDGAMGTMLQLENLDEDVFRGTMFGEHSVCLEGLNDILVLTRPGVVKKIHQGYLEAGADIITTNTFNANYISLKQYELGSYVYEINHKAAGLAKDAIAGYNNKCRVKSCFVAGAIGPTGKTASVSPDIKNSSYRDVTFDDLFESYRLQAQGLIDGGVDILMVETVFDTLNARAALYAINEIRSGLKRDIPVLVSVTIDESGRNFSGQTVEAFYNSLFPFSLFSIGINCSFSGDKMGPYLKRLSVKSQLPVSVYPNTGLPGVFGDYDQSPGQMAEQIETFCREGLVNIVGGCCGSRPDHIKAIAETAARYKPRVIQQNPPTTRLSGLQSLGVKDSTRIIRISEKTHVTGSKRFARLIREEKYEEALEIARDQITEGADILNISLDEGMIDTQKAIVTFLNCLTAEPDIANVPLMLDSSDFEVIKNGLKCLQGRSIINSISLKEGEDVFKQKAYESKKFGAVVVVMAIDEKGQADTFGRKKEICRRAYDILTVELNFQPEDIIFDPGVLAIGTEIESHNNYAVEFIDSIRWIKQNLPYTKVNAGISNISYAFCGNNYLRDIINSVFLYHCEQAGLDFAIINPSQIIDYHDIPAKIRKAAEDLVLNRRENATERLVKIASGFRSKSFSYEQKSTWRKQDPENRIIYALCNGFANFIEKDIEELMNKHDNALEIIQGPLMEGMKRVGDLFSSGKMFLPQVIKSTRVMNRAVEYLTMKIGKHYSSAAESEKVKKKILLATVEGDVHDIGKNIIALVLRSNNYNVIDLGIMVPNKDVISAIEHEKPDIVGLSGLISAALDKMTDIVKIMELKNFRIPVLLGGAATSALHTAVKVAPFYGGTVIQVPDVVQSITVVNKLLDSDAGSEIQKIREHQKRLRTRYIKKKTASRLLSLEEARKMRYRYKMERPVKPRLLGTKLFDNFDLNQLRRYIDWTPFFHGWGLKGKYPSIFEKERIGSEAERLFGEAYAMLDDIEKNKLIRPRGIIGLFPANSKDDDVLIFKDDKRKDVIMKIPMLRQQQVKDKDGFTLSLADFIAPVDPGIEDYFGGFAVTTGIGIEKYLQTFKENGDSYNSIMFRLIADRLVEAAAEIMHVWVRKKYWGYVPDENLSIVDLIKGKFKGIRPAVGYPACPDHRLKKYLFDLLKVEERIGISLTDIYAMKPASSVSGFYLANDASKYFGVGKIGKDQISDYADRQGLDVEKTEKWLYFALNK